MSWIPQLCGPNQISHLTPVYRILFSVLMDLLGLFWWFLLIDSYLISSALFERRPSARGGPLAIHIVNRHLRFIHTNQTYKMFKYSCNISHGIVSVENRPVLSVQLIHAHIHTDLHPCAHQKQNATAASSPPHQIPL